MKFPPKWLRVADEARKSNFFVTRTDNSRIWVRKTQNIESLGVVMWADGTAYRTDIDAQATKNLKTEAAVMRCLGL
jgi:hypothetical protein